MTNNTNATGNAGTANGTQGTFQNITNTTPSLKSGSGSAHSRNLSNVSTDENQFKMNFYQGAKSSGLFFIFLLFIHLQIKRYCQDYD